MGIDKARSYYVAGICTLLSDLRYYSFIYADISLNRFQLGACNNRSGNYLFSAVNIYAPPLLLKFLCSIYGRAIICIIYNFSFKFLYYDNLF
jgi:hypothetical protein